VDVMLVLLIISRSRRTDTRKVAGRSQATLSPSVLETPPVAWRPFTGERF
jgi:hypothetical protein